MFIFNAKKEFRENSRWVFFKRFKTCNTLFIAIKGNLKGANLFKIIFQKDFFSEFYIPLPLSVLAHKDALIV
jgi:hypothetical protein